MKVALAVLLISLALIDARGAQASSSSTVEGTKEASATFDTQLDGIRNSVEISVAETDLTTAEGTERGLHANIEILQADSRRGDTRIVDVAGGVDTQPGGFQLKDDLSTASLHVTIPVCGGFDRDGQFDNEALCHASRHFAELMDPAVVAEDVVGG